MFSISMVTRLDHSIYADLHNELLYDFDNLWFIRHNEGFLMYQKGYERVHMYSDLTSALDFFKSMDRPQVVSFERKQDIVTAIQHSSFDGMVLMRRIIKSKDITTYDDQEVIHLDTLDFHPSYIGNYDQISHYHFIDSNWSRYHDPVEIAWEEDPSDEDLLPYHEEFQYLRLCRKILAAGLYTAPEKERTGTGTIGIFGHQMKFSLRNNRFPLLTTKKVFWKGIVAELMMMLRGGTDSNELEEQGVNIWNGNTSRDFLDHRGLQHLPEGDLGNLYGRQWRGWGCKYIDCHTDYTGQGIDQLAKIVQEIKTNPNSRRLVLSAWNVSQLDEGVLVPCHFTCTFSVRAGELYCSVKFRSNDVFLGQALNIGQYALLTCIIASLTNLKPGELTYVIDDGHLYLSHIDAILTQLLRTPYPFPKMFIRTPRPDLDSWTATDFELVDYQSDAAIRATMAV